MTRCWIPASLLAEHLAAGWVLCWYTDAAGPIGRGAGCVVERLS